MAVLMFRWDPGQMCYSVLIKKRQCLGVLHRLKDPLSLGNSTADGQALIWSLWIKKYCTNNRPSNWEGKKGGLEAAIAEHSQMIWFWGRLDYKLLPWWYAAPLGFIRYLLLFIGWSLSEPLSWTWIWKNTRYRLRNQHCTFDELDKWHFWMPNFTQTSLHLLILLFLLQVLEIRLTKINYTPAHMWLLLPPTTPTLVFFFFSGRRPWRPLHHWRVASWRAGLHSCSHSDSIAFLTYKKTPTQHVLCTSLKSFAFCASPHTVTKWTFSVGSRSPSRQSKAQNFYKRCQRLLDLQMFSWRVFGEPLL